MINNFILFMNNLQTKDNDIILMIDANEAFSEHNSKINKLLTKT